MCFFPKKWTKNEYAFGADVLRLAFGLLFLLVGVKKLRMGYTGFAEALIAGEGNLANEIPHMVLYAYGLALPALELLAGVLLLAKRYVQEAYGLVALIYLTFVFGQQYDGNTAKVGTEYIPSIMALALAYVLYHRASKK